MSNPAPTPAPITKQQLVRARRMARAAGILQGLEAALRPGDLVVDCGANVGSITTRLAATGADVVAFEPDPVAFQELETATRDMPNVTRHQAAVGVADGTADLYRGERFDENPIVSTRRSTITPGANRMQGVAMQVEVVNLPARLKDWVGRPGGVAFLKLDVEGAELDILTDMLRFDLFEQVKLTVAELLGYKFPEIREEFQALRKVIRARYPDTRVWLDWI
jgi:FkbM family methyltransferase